MTPREIEALLWAHRDAARGGARDAGVPDRYLDDVVQEALIIAWRRITSHSITLPDGRRSAVYVVRAFLRQTAFLFGRLMAKRLRRVELHEDAWHELPPVDPEPMLEARVELRELVEGTGIRELERGMPLDVYVLSDPIVSATTRASRRFRLRGGRHK